ncbi:MAG: hypothetical protein PHN99_06445 [Eubacteriales bacterium]|nr:hypothetical protein [Eubacteriales bacterium]NCU26599.1 hypothetical protein [Candidatus Nomurabacteria bacterium]
MELMIIVLNKTEKMDTFLETLLERRICGATILDSIGMVRELSKKSEDYPIFGTLNFLVDTGHQQSKTIFIALSKAQVDEVKNILRDIVGDLNEPDTAIVITLPISSTEGIVC